MLLPSLTIRRQTTFAAGCCKTRSGTCLMLCEHPDAPQLLSRLARVWCTRPLLRLHKTWKVLQYTTKQHSNDFSATAYLISKGVRIDGQPAVTRLSQQRRRLRIAVGSQRRHQLAGAELAGLPAGRHDELAALLRERQLLQQLLHQQQHSVSTHQDERRSQWTCIPSSCSGSGQFAVKPT